MIDSRKIARLKYQKALALIELAEERLREARQELSPLVGAAEQWKLVGDEYDRVHQLWRNVAYSIARDNVDLDSTTKHAMDTKADSNEK